MSRSAGLLGGVTSAGAAARKRYAPWCAFALLLALTSASGTPVQAAECHLGRLAELPVTMRGMRPMVHASINGTDALFIADSGAFFNSLSPAAAAAFKLRLEPLPWVEVSGVGGHARTWLTKVKTFTIFGQSISDVPFLVAGNDLGEDAVGLLGQNVFRIADVEYDLANGAIRLLRPHDCKAVTLAYWAKGNSQSISVIDIWPASREEPHTAGVAYLNGNKIRVMFDTGAGTSMLTLDAAKRAGITPNSDRVVAGGESIGIGSRTMKTWIAPFQSFRIGDEEIRNTRLRIGEFDLRYVDMLIGADFFLSHRIYVASSQGKLYFTYNGGPVFNLTATHRPESAPAAAPGPTVNTGDQPTDAAGFARRGTASAARRDFAPAIADLTRACELAPTEATYFYERGTAHWGNGQPDLALADFDAAIKLKADDVPSLIARARLRADRRDSAAVVTDLDAADRAAPKEAAERLQMGRMYLFAGQPAAAVVQYSKWIDAHPREDVHMDEARNLRCRARALWGQELDEALTDCNTALRIRPNTANYLESRGLLYVRRNSYDKAITDYDTSLRLEPKDAWSLYGRGLARLHKGETAAGQADIAAATAIDPKIVELAAKYGIGP
jgi:tetratricopeptide (TPR) repeat protein/predicted aspartyl protease